jgi:hypothetical protein
MCSNIGYVEYLEIYPAAIDLFEFFCSTFFGLGQCFHHGNVVLAIWERFPLRGYLQC